MGQRLFNSKYCFALQDVGDRQTSASVGAWLSCGQEQGEEKDFVGADGRWQAALAAHVEQHGQVCWDQSGTKKQTPLYIRDFSVFQSFTEAE